MNPIFKLRFVAFLICFCLGACAFAQEIGVKLFGDFRGTELAISRPISKIRDLPYLGDVDVSAFMSVSKSVSLGVGPEKTWQVGKSNLFVSLGFGIRMETESDRVRFRTGLALGVTIR